MGFFKALETKQSMCSTALKSIQVKTKAIIAKANQQDVKECRECRWITISQRVSSFHNNKLTTWLKARIWWEETKWGTEPTQVWAILLATSPTTWILKCVKLDTALKIISVKAQTKCCTMIWFQMDLFSTTLQTQTSETMLIQWRTTNQKPAMAQIKLIFTKFTWITCHKATKMTKCNKRWEDTSKRQAWFRIKRKVHNNLFRIRASRMLSWKIDKMFSNKSIN